MTRGYLRLLPGLRDSASMIGAKSVPALASTYSIPRSASRARKNSAVMRALSVTERYLKARGLSWGWLACPFYHAELPTVQAERTISNGAARFTYDHDR